MSKARGVAQAALFGSGVLLGTLLRPGAAVQAQPDHRVFEIRTYTTPEGKLPALNAQFRDHTVHLFQRHGMISVGYWTPQDAPLARNTLIYILAHPDRDAAKRNWDAFRKDPDWQKALADSERDGKLIAKIDSVYLDPTDYSAIK